MDRGSLGESGRKRRRIGLGDHRGVDPTEAVGDLARTGERHLHRDLLIKEHAD
jgi:hypothetical protein